MHKSGSRVSRPYRKSILVFCDWLASSICAVHGLEGHAADSFTAESKLWLRDLLPNEPGFKDARISTFGYNSRLFDRNASDKLLDWADYLLEGISKLRTSTNTSHAPLIFVCHSMGGLVVRKAIEHLDRYGSDSKYDSIELEKCAILFLSTPHEGTTEADYSSFLTGILRRTSGLRNDEIVKQLKSFNDSAAQAKRSWNHMKHVPPVECLTESKKTKISTFKSVMVC